VARYPDSHKQEARGAILKIAAERFRRDGIAAVGVRSLMADAGLTHGGFYAHFSSRADLVAAAAETAAASTIGYFEQVLAAAPAERKLETLVATYLRQRHRTHIELGCAAAALAPEIARESPETRSRFAAQTARLVQLIADVLPPGGTPNDRDARARTVFALMMGALQLMRIETDASTVDRLIREGREAVISLATRPW
jgi:TetR/AcrR family transcriptional repressor of nem operon